MIDIAVEEVGRIYFAVKGRLVGYFRISFCIEEDKQIEWHSDSWVELKNPPSAKPFQGFKYVSRDNIK